MPDVNTTNIDWLTELDPTPGRLLYHYTTADTLAKILGNATLRLSPYANTNDPRESKEWYPRIILSAGGISPDTLATASEARQRSDRLLRRGARVACFTVDGSHHADAEAGSLFHRGWARARMWDQYASRHSGACLVFDRDRLVEQVDSHVPHGNNDLLTWGAVTYADECMDLELHMSEVLIYGLDLAVDQLQTAKGVVNKIYLTKNRDWASEQEWRFVAVRWDLPDTELADAVSIPYGESLKAVVVGEHFTQTELSPMRDELEGSVALARCEWENGCPGVVAL